MSAFPARSGFSAGSASRPTRRPKRSIRCSRSSSRASSARRAVSLGIVEGAAEAVNSVAQDRLGPPGRSLAGRSGRWCCSATASPRSHGRSSRSRRRGRRCSPCVCSIAWGRAIRGAPRDAMLAGVGDADDPRERCTASTAGWIISARWSARCSRRRSCTSTGRVPDALRADDRPRRDRRRVDLLRRGADRPSSVRLERGPVRQRVRVCVSRLRPDRGTASAGPRTAAPLPREFKSFMLVLTLFTLGNSTDAFLLLKLTDVAGSRQVHPADVGGAARRQGHGVGRRRQLVGSYRAPRGHRDRLARLRRSSTPASRVSESLPALLTGSWSTVSTSASRRARRRRSLPIWRPATRRGFAFGDLHRGAGPRRARRERGLRAHLAWLRSRGRVRPRRARWRFVATALLFVVVRPSARPKPVVKRG